MHRMGKHVLLQNQKRRVFISQHCLDVLGADELRVQLLTMTGKSIYRGMAKPRNGILHVPAGSLPQGAYVLKLADGKGMSAAARCILTK